MVAPETVNWRWNTNWRRGRIGHTVRSVAGIAMSGATLASLAAEGAVASVGMTPNVVIILADDLGWGDVTSLNPQSAMPTPRIDSIATEGMRFTDAHSPSSVCTPTRYGLLTGRYAWRTWLKKENLGAYDEPLITPDRATLGTLLQAHGYRTGAVGKWHLGLNFPKLPEEETTNINLGIDFADGEITGGPVDLGFDEFFGVGSNYGWGPYVYIRDNRFTAVPFMVQRSIASLWIRSGPMANDYDFREVLDRLTEEAVAFIERSAETDAPFLLYFPLTAPHVPFLAAERFRRTTGLGDYGDYIANVDWAVGEVLDALVQAGVRGSTLVAFASDNGSFIGTVPDSAETDHIQDSSVRAYRESTHRSKGHWSGGKGTLREGGHRVPLFVRWPGVVEAGSENTDTVSLTDFYATLADILGEPTEPGVAPDSRSMLPMLRGESAVRGVPIVHHSQYGRFAIRDGRWKLKFINPWRLYDLSEDPAEASSILEEHPQVSARLEASMDAIRSFADQGQLVLDTADLSGLALSGVDFGTFDPAETTYTAVAGSAVATTTVTATPRHASSTVVVADFLGATAGTSRTVSLAEGANPVTVTVTASDGTAARTYTVWVHSDFRGEGTLQLAPTDFAVTVSPSAIREGESATVTMAVGNGLTFAKDQAFALAVTGTATAADYRLLPDTLTLAAGASSATVELAALDDAEEEEPETVTITAAHGIVAGGSATVTINSVSHDATLSALSLSGIDIGTFASGTTDYAATVAHAVTSTTVAATATHTRARVEIPPGAGASLAEGANAITVTVTAEDGETTKTYTVTLTRAGAPLTASFASLPEAHAGAGRVALRIQFSEPVATSDATLRDSSFVVTNGTVRTARRVDGRGDLWEIEVEPASAAEMVVVLPPTTDCAAAGAVCTRDGKGLSARLEATIPGGAALPVVSIAAVASPVPEGEPAEFRVSLTEPAAERLRVGIRWARSDGSESTVRYTNLPAGMTGNSPRFSKYDDKVVGEDLTVTLTLEDGAGYVVSEEARSAEVVLEENDEAEFALSVDPAEVAEGGSASVRVEITNGVTFAEDQAITFDYAGSTATKGADYAMSPESLTLRGGPIRAASAVTATLSAVEDADEEGGETVSIAA